ncbi:sucrase ferredoxin [Corynebacterium kozikiae]|uniref:sucrase ferredoxin n=1 Tax=Corynebacterium kozikiae TaxID=2968469 RepID=UPI00211B8083|nr:sucrase ferredoxin [Corynebacterium sp. 76QC2CO]MCQ9343177.1 sucrase ferredoxin [Corynebacterium sp. 76QC2CO]
MNLAPRCSDNNEPLPGTAKRGDTFVLLEHPGPWSHDILDGHTFGADTERLSALPGLTLIRRPGREGHQRGHTRTVYLVFSAEGVAERLHITSLDDLFTLDLTGPGRNDAEPVSTLMLVCTHAKRDQCCAIKGRPIAADLAARGAHVWESSHTKGHRFAPAIVIFPHGYVYGRLNAEAALQAYTFAERGEIFLPGLRGRGLYDAPGQAAEIAVLGELGQARFGDLSVHGTEVRHRDGRVWHIDARQETMDVVASCGAASKPGKVWVAKIRP